MVDETTYRRRHDIDPASQNRLGGGGGGGARNQVVPETSEAHAAQVRHYCLLLARRGVTVRGGVVHYPLIRRTLQVDWDEQARQLAEQAEAEARQVIATPTIPNRLPRPQCRGCAYLDYCWGD